MHDSMAGTAGSQPLQLTHVMLRAQTHCWRVMDTASGAPLADIVASSGVRSVHIAADAFGRLQVKSW